MTQYSLFGAEVAAATLDDLDGIPLAGGRWVRSRSTARLSVVVDAQWRADALAEEFARRGVGSDLKSLSDTRDGWSVRTGFTDELAPVAARWTRGANEGPPRDLRLTAAGLRLWAIAAGRPDGVGYLLATSRPDDAIHMAAGAQLSRLGVAAVSIGVRGGPGWRITSARRLRRFVEVIGSPPPGAGARWPDHG